MKKNHSKHDGISMSNGSDDEGGNSSSGETTETTETTEDGKKIKQLEQQLADSQKELDETKSLLVRARANEESKSSNSSEPTTPTCMTEPSIIKRRKIADARNDIIYKQLGIHRGLCAALMKEKNNKDGTPKKAKKNTNIVLMKGDNSNDRNEDMSTKVKDNNNDDVASKENNNDVEEGKVLTKEQHDNQHDKPTVKAMPTVKAITVNCTKHDNIKESPMTSSLVTEISTIVELVEDGLVNEWDLKDTGDVDKAYYLLEI